MQISEAESVVMDVLWQRSTLAAEEVVAALLATWSDLTEAFQEALLYLDQALDHGFRPGMGRAVADRLFWAAADPADDGSADAADTEPVIDIPHPFNETKH